MKNIRFDFYEIFGVLCIFLLSLFINPVTAQEKLTAHELIIKHLESIGSTEARTAINSFIIIGTSKATFQGRGGGTSEGLSVLASEGEKYMVAMKFDNADYPFEKMGYDGNDFSVGFISPGKRTVLGQFLQTNKSIFKLGIMSGALSTSWTLLNFDEKEAKLKYVGIKKVGGKKLHELEYNPKKGSDMSVSLFFEPDTFRHVRTEYKRSIAARQGATVDNSAEQSETRYTLTEDFSDFKEENKLVLPHTYKMYMEILTGNGTISYEWLMNLQKFNFNQPINDKEFKVDSY